MRWVAPTEKDTATETLEKLLWAEARACASACSASKQTLTGDGIELELELLAK